ncbi:hypothetical protein [Sinomicrobium oceani]|uniref:hypothetical protein n=1 Tax=Sinomicrobium oceani TaxID=1150368 RepID=UPI00227D3C69|nr:hypothetical protein [Sinomicrobium oceani]
MRNILKKISAYVPYPRERARVGVLFLLLPFTFYAQSNTFPASGNVGIGTLNPETVLEVKSSDFIVSKFRRLGGVGGTALQIENASGTGAWNLGVGDNTHFSIWKASGGFGELFILKQTGELGVGADPGSWKLAVNGKIRAKEIKVETGWSDFVFEESYHLPTLEEVEQHIKEKGHLKDIPSAKQVKENGIFLGEMDAKLLQKIEELMLYTLQQQKEIEILRQEIRKLQEKQ